MSRRATAVKLACLIVPLGIGILSLRMGGEAIGGAVTRILPGPRYETRRIGPFLIRAARPGAHEATAEVLQEFVDAIVPGYGDVLGLNAPGPSSPLAVHLVASRKELSGLDGPHPADEEQHDGRFSPARREIALVGRVAARGAEADRRALRHLATHALLHAAEPAAEWSPWFGEGLAEYFREGSRAAPGRITREQLRALSRLREENQLLPLARLFAAREGDFAGPGRLHFYAQAHGLTAFLLESRERRPGFLEYCREERRPGPVRPAAFAELVGSVEEIEREWRDWLRLAE